MEMYSISSGICRKPRRYLPCRLSAFGINGWASGSFRRLAWKCQDGRLAASLGIIWPSGAIRGFSAECIGADVRGEPR